MKKNFWKNFKTVLILVVCILPKLCFGTNWGPLSPYNIGPYSFANGDTIDGSTGATFTGVTINIGITGPNDVINLAGVIVAGNSYITFDNCIINVTGAGSLALAGSAAGDPLVIQFRGSNTINIDQGSELKIGNVPLVPGPLQHAYAVIRGDVSSSLTISGSSVGSGNPLLTIATGSSLSFAGNQGTVSNASLNLVGLTTSNLTNALLLKVEDGASLDVEMVQLPVATGSDFGPDIYVNANYPYSSTTGIGVAALAPTSPAPYNMLPSQTDGAGNPGVATLTIQNQVLIESNNSNLRMLRDNILQAPVAAIGFPCRAGVIIGNATLVNILSDSYLLYVAAFNNVQPSTNIQGQSIAQLRKWRNPSSMLVEGPNQTFPVLTAPGSPIAPSVVALIPVVDIAEHAALYFMSSRGGFDNNGLPVSVNAGGSTTAFDYEVPWYRQAGGMLGYGNLVLITEGMSIFKGANIPGTAAIPATLLTPAVPATPAVTNSVIGIISQEVTLNGGPLAPGQVQTIFPAYTFSESSFPGNPNQYGKACVMFDGDVVLSHLSWLCANDLHQIYPVTTLGASEPSMMGGDTWFDYYYLQNGTTPPPGPVQLYWSRPKIALDNSDIIIANKNGMAVAGADFLVCDIRPYLPTVLPASTTNNCEVQFLYDGLNIPKYLCLGTPADGTIAISATGSGLDWSSSWDDVQSGTYPAVPALSPTLIETRIFNDVNSAAFCNTLPGGSALITNPQEKPVGTIVLNGLGNISTGLIGNGGFTSAAGYSDILATPNNCCPCSFVVDGQYLNIASSTMILDDPVFTTAAGYGVFTVGPMGVFQYMNNAAGVVNIPTIGINLVTAPTPITLPCGVTPYEPQILIPDAVPQKMYFGTEIATSPTTAYTLLAAAGQTIDTVLYDARYSQNPSLVPYLYPITTENPAFSHTLPTLSFIDNAPVVNGYIKRLLIGGSFGAFVGIIDGGYVGEAIDSSVAKKVDYAVDTTACGFFVLRNGGKLGIGSSMDIDNRSINVFGQEGFIVGLDGKGKVEFNGATTQIWGTGQVVAFSDGGLPNELQLYGHPGTRVTVRPGSLFDFTALKPGDHVLITGSLEIVCEPGSGIAIPADVTVEFSDNAVLRLGIQGKLNGTITNDISSSAVHFLGQGKLVFSGSARFEIDRGAYATIEALHDANNAFQTPGPGEFLLIQGNDVTDLTIEVTDAAQVLFGKTRLKYGGAIQIGNVRPITFGVGPTSAQVSATIHLNGQRATLSMGKQAFLGLGAGLIVDQHDAPDNWKIANLYDVKSISFIVDQGEFLADQHNPGNNEKASLIALGYWPAPTFNIAFCPPNAYESFTGQGSISTTPKRATIYGGSNLVAISAAGSLVASGFSPIVDDQIITLPGNYTGSILVSTGQWGNPTRPLTAYGVDTANAFAHLTHDVIGSGSLPSFRQGNKGAGRYAYVQPDGTIVREKSLAVGGGDVKGYAQKTGAIGVHPNNGKPIFSNTKQ